MFIALQMKNKMFHDIKKILVCRGRRTQHKSIRRQDLSPLSHGDLERNMPVQLYIIKTDAKTE